MFPYQEIFFGLNTCFSSLGIIFNFLLIYCIAYKSPRNIASYSILLLNGVISDLLTCIATIMVQPRIISYQTSLFFIANGFCTLLGGKTCMIAYTFLLTFYSHLNFSQLASFVYRLFVLRNEPPKKRTMLICIILTAAPTVLIVVGCTIPYLVNTWNMDFRPNITLVHPEIVLTDRSAVFGAPDGLVDLQGSLANIWATVPIFPITIAVFTIRYKILKSLSSENILSETTKKMHKSFLKALTLQSCLPPIYILSVIMFMADVRLQLHNPILEYSQGWGVLISVITPLFSLYFISPYRHFVKGLLLKHKRNVADLITTNKVHSWVSGSTNPAG